MRRGLIAAGTVMVTVLGMFAGAALAEVPLCYSRSYDARHLAKHPHQTVTVMEFAYKQRSGEYQLWLKRRGQTTLFYNAGRCDAGSVNGKLGIYCHARMDCDGDCGSFGVVFEGGKSLLAYFNVGMGTFHLHSDDGQDVLRPQLDDDVFRLHRGDSSDCAFNNEYTERLAPTDYADLSPVPLEEGFRSPTGNISCRIEGGDEATLTCVINEIAKEPKVPAWCEYDWGGMFSLAQAGAGERVCHSDTIDTDGLQVIPYGAVWSFKGYRCSSEREGVTCRNSKGNGIFLSRARQDVF